MYLYKNSREEQAVPVTEIGMILLPVLSHFALHFNGASMAEEIENQDEVKEPKKKQGLSLIAIIGIIVGFLVVQVAAMYFLVPMIMNSGNHAESDKKEKKAGEEKQGDKAHEEAPTEEEDDGTHVIRKIGTIVPVLCGEKDEIIINPRGSSTRYVIFSIGLEMQPSGEEEEEASGEGEGGGEKSSPLMIPVCDKIISTVSSKSLEELQEPLTRDSLRIQLRRDLQPYFGEKRIRTVYFPRFIIQ